MFVIFAISKVYDGPNKSIKGTTNLQPGGKKDAEVDCNHVQCGSMITENSHVNTDNGC